MAIRKISGSHCRLERQAIRLAFRRRLNTYRANVGAPSLNWCRVMWQAAVYEVNLAVMNGEIW